MIPEKEDRLSHSITKKVVQQACLRLRQKEDILYNQDVLEALHDLTGLSRSELAGIAREARAREAPAFFSIQHQVVMAGGFLLSITAAVFFTIRLLS